jgi:hypothetical protein
VIPSLVSGSDPAHADLPQENGDCRDDQQDEDESVASRPLKEGTNDVTTDAEFCILPGMDAASFWNREAHS